MLRGTRPRHWLVALVALALALGLGWLVVTHILHLAADQTTKAIETHEDAPSRPGG